jgi:hypothetical protein
MANTFMKIASVTVGSGGAATIAFSSIPSTYTDLQLFISGRTSSSNPTINLRFNSDTTSTNYYRKAVLSYGGGVQSNSVNDMGAGGYAPYTGYTASTFGSNLYYIPNYTSSNQKSYNTDSVTENNATDNYVALIAGLWTGTAAITGITIYPAVDGSWSQYSTATLYGIKNS